MFGLGVTVWTKGVKFLHSNGRSGPNDGRDRVALQVEKRALHNTGRACPMAPVTPAKTACRFSGWSPRLPRAVSAKGAPCKRKARRVPRRKAEPGNDDGVWCYGHVRPSRVDSSLNSRSFWLPVPSQSTSVCMSHRSNPRAGATTQQSAV